MMPARTIVAAGLLTLVLALPGAAQTTGPADGGAQRNDQFLRGPEPAPPVTRATPPAGELKADPPARADDEFALPPAGCRFRENKLDLIV